MLEQILVADDGSDPPARRASLHSTSRPPRRTPHDRRRDHGDGSLAVWQRRLDKTTADIPDAVTTSTVVRQGAPAELLIDLAAEVEGLR
jgi:hypothetical protein